MSQNRQTIKDRATAETDFKVNLKNEVNIETILRELGEFRAEANTRMEALEKHTGYVGGSPQTPGAPERTVSAVSLAPPTPSPAPTSVTRRAENQP